MSMRSGMFVGLAVGLCLMLGAYADADARRKPQPTVECLQNGQEVTEVAAGTQVTITGSGYRSNTYLTVCVENEGCTGSRTNSEGSFLTGRIFDVPGTHLLRVYELSRNRSRSTLRALSEITVTAD